MTTVTTTTVTNPLIWPSTTLIDRSPVTGHLWAMVKSSTANTYELWRSQDNGGTWALVTSQTRASVQEISSIFIAYDGFIYWAFRTYESGQDRIYGQRIYVKGSTVIWGTQTLLASATAASAGAVYTGLDVNTAMAGSGTRYIAVGVGTTSGSKIGVTMLGMTIDSADVPRSSLAIYGGSRWWNATGSGRITPTVEIEHVGDDKTGNNAHLWVVWGRTDVYLAKMSWNAGAWYGPTSPVKLNPVPLSPAQDYVKAVWDGQRLSVVYPDPSSTSTVRVIERNRANTATTQRQTPAHPAGVVRTCTAGYNAVTGDLRVYAVGTSNPDLYYVDFIRSSGTWSAWTLFSATDIIGTPPNNYSVRRSTYGNARYDVLTAGGVSPFTITHTSQLLSYAPSPPAWDSAAIGYDNGAAADVNAALPLAWTFSDPDPADTQSAWALSRQIGAGAVQYLRASDNTWQPTEQKNTGATPSRSLPAMTVSDAFSRSVSGTLGTTDTGQPWNIRQGAAAQFSANGSAGQVSVNAVGTAFVATVAQTFSDYGIRALVTCPVVAAGAEIEAELVGAWTDNSNMYLYRVLFLPSGQLEVRMSAVVAGAFTTVNVATGLAYVAGQQVVVAAQRVGSSHVMKAYPLLSAEPGWQLSMTNSALGSGEAGHRSIILGGNTNTLPVVLSYDEFAVGSGGLPWSSPSDAPHTYAVKVWDSANVASLYSSGFAVVPSVKANPAITAPAPAAVLTTDTATVSWTVSQQTAYRVTLATNPGGLVVYDSGWQASSATSLAIPYRLPDLTGWTIAVQTRNTQGLASNVASVNVTVDYLEPPVPTVSVTPLPASGVIRAVITNPAPAGGQPALADQDLWRRVVGDTSEGVRKASGLASGATYDDWTAVSGVPYEYRVMARGVNGTSVFGVWTP